MIAISTFGLLPKHSIHQTKNTERRHYYNFREKELAIWSSGMSRVEIFCFINIVTDYQMLLELHTFTTVMVCSAIFERCIYLHLFNNFVNPEQL